LFRLRGLDFFSWFYIYLAKVRGLDIKASALYSALPPLAMVACSLSGGAINDALSRAYGKRVGRCGSGFWAASGRAFLVPGSRAAYPLSCEHVLSGAPAHSTFQARTGQ